MVYLAVGFILFVALFFVLGFDFREEKFEFRSRVFFAFFAFLVIIPGFVTKVNAVEVGILYDPFKGGVQEETLDEGYHIKNIFATTYKISTAQQSISFNYNGSAAGETFSVQTKNGEFAIYAVELKYRVEDASNVFGTWKGLPTAANLSQYVQSSIKGTAVDFTIYEILGVKFEESRSAAEDSLRLQLIDFGIDLISLNFIDIDAGTEIESAIIRQGTSAKEEEINLNLQAAASVAAETARIEAEGIANAAIEAATGAAEAVRLEADAEAYALEIVAAAEQELINLLGLTPDEYIEYIKWNIWDGVLPTVMAGDSTAFILDLPETP
ncbi:MAG: SPFH domain-containing protein [Candidatus Izemoplasma sp.]